MRPQNTATPLPGPCPEVTATDVVDDPPGGFSQHCLQQPKLESHLKSSHGDQLHKSRFAHTVALQKDLKERAVSGHPLRASPGALLTPLQLHAKSSAKVLWPGGKEA